MLTTTAWWMMLTALMTVAAAALAAAPLAAPAPALAAAQDPTTRPEEKATSIANVPGVYAEHLYNGVSAPMLVRVVSPRSFGTVAIMLMDENGRELAPPIDVHPGLVDLAEKLPAIRELRRAAYLQLMDGQQPAGSALVLQPMLSRMVPVTRIEPHPMTQEPHLRIVDWIDENQAVPATQPSPQTQPEAETDSESAPETAQDSPQDATQSSTESIDESAPDQANLQPQRLFTGLRMYPEQDVVLHTTLGDIRLAMCPHEAPNTAWNFLELVRGGFYRNVQFHRVVKFDRLGRPFVIQAGDPGGTGDGGPGYWLPIEDSKLGHDLGVISMARADDPDSSGSQFFICLSREGTSRLDGQYCSFGYAVEGLSAIVAIAESPLADIPAGRPADPPVITHAVAVAAPPRIPGRGRPDDRVSPEQIQQKPRPSGKVPR